MENSQNGFLLPLLIVIVAIMAIGGGAYYYSYSQNNVETPKVSINTQSTTTTIQTLNDTSSAPNSDTNTTQVPSTSKPFIVDKNKAKDTTLVEGQLAFKSTAYNVTFKYRAELIFEIRANGTPNTIAFENAAGNPVFHISVYNALATYGQSGKDFLTQRISTLKTNYPDGLSTIIINNEQAFIGKSCFKNGSCTKQVYVAHGDYYYEIFSALGIDNPTNLKIFDEVVATFKFTK